MTFGVQENMLSIHHSHRNVNVISDLVVYNNCYAISCHQICCV